jgi:hypothetical protein
VIGSYESSLAGDADFDHFYIYFKKISRRFTQIEIPQIFAENLSVLLGVPLRFSQRDSARTFFLFSSTSVF